MNTRLRDELVILRREATSLHQMRAVSLGRPRTRKLRMALEAQRILRDGHREEMRRHAQGIAPAYAQWVGLRILPVLALALTLIGCAGRERATVSVGPGVDRADVIAAAKLWNDASPSFALGVVDDGVPADVRTEAVELPSPKCAEADMLMNVIRLSPSMGPVCKDNMAVVIAHEWGHWMANRNDHLGAGNVMAAEVHGIVKAPTAGDVAYVLGEGAP